MNNLISAFIYQVFFHLNSFLQYIVAELGLSEGDEQLSSPSKEHLDQERQLLLAFKPVMQKFLNDHTELQVSALYALQVHFNANAFPKGNELLALEHVAYP